MPARPSAAQDWSLDRRDDKRVPVEEDGQLPPGIERRLPRVPRLAGRKAICTAGVPINAAVPTAEVTLSLQSGTPPIRPLLRSHPKHLRNRRRRGVPAPGPSLGSAGASPRPALFGAQDDEQESSRAKAWLQDVRSARRQKVTEREGTGLFRRR